MYLVTAFIKPYKLDELKDALPSIGIVGMTASDVRGVGQQAGCVAIADGVEESLGLLPKIKVEVAVEPENIDRCLQAISDILNTGKIGDGKVLVTKLQQIVHVRTGEKGPRAVATIAPQAIEATA